MFTICTNCGEYHPYKDVDPSGPYLICPHCNHKRKFTMVPLFIITGASGTGKSALLNELLQLDEKPDLVYLESDMLWREEFAAQGTQPYRDLWLHVCFNISQSKHPVALFGSTSPSEFENSPMRKYFSEIHYLVLVCERGTLEDRLLRRPKWRSSSNPEKIREHIDWNQWFIENASSAGPRYSVLDTTNKGIVECVQGLIEWINKFL